MPKKAKQTTKQTKANKDFFFLISVSVFAALTLFAANFLAQAKQEAVQAAKRQALPVAQLEPVASPSPTGTPKVTPRPTPYKYGVPNQK